MTTPNTESSAPGTPKLSARTEAAMSPRRTSTVRSALTVYRKELVDALRDRRTLLTVFLSSVALGPIVMIALSAMIGGMERRAEQREVYVAGAEHAPSLMNYFERQTLIVKAPPDDFEALIKASKFNDAVIVIEPDFEPKLASADVPTVEIISNSANSRMSGAQRRVSRLMQGFSQEQQGQRMTSRGLSPAALETIDVQERDLASLGARSAQFMSMVPFFLIMAVLYGAMTAALDTTAGERERGSLEPLLMNPVAREDLVVGKWGAVVTVGMLIALLSCLSFIPTQAFLRSETLAAMFQFGWREFALFLFILLPFAAALSALMMAISIRSKSFKEAQSSNTVVIMGVTLLPVMQLFGQQGDTPWHNYVPALAQISLMNRVLRGDSLPLVDLLIPLVVGVLVAIACLTYVARSLNQSAIR